LETNEIWKDILDYNDYQVSNFGRVKSLKFRKEKILKQIKGNRDYFEVGLSKNGISKPKQVHRLVYETFKEKLEEGYDVHHINEDRENNFVENLESKPHGKHMSDHKTGKHHSEKTRIKTSEKMKGKNSKLTEYQVIKIKILLKEEKLSQQEIADMFGVSRLTISAIKTGRTWSHIKI
jgi:DNA-binding transcriptional regulator YiaG